MIEHLAKLSIENRECMAMIKIRRWLFIVIVFIINGVISIAIAETTHPSGSVVKINDDNTLIVNGKLFLPIMLYHIDIWEKGGETDPFTKGFNTIQISGSNPASYRKALDRALASNLMGLVALEGLMDNRYLIRQIVEKCKNHPALLGWCLQDEPNLRLAIQNDEYKEPPEKLLKVYNLIKSIDPGHPVFLNLINTAGDYKIYTHTTDIIATDIYPVPSVPFNTIVAGLEVAKSEVGNNKPIWFATQMSPVRADLGTKDRAPTPEEIRCMSYLAIIHGVKGLSYYAYSDPGWLISKDNPQLWSSFKGLTDELKEIAPVVFAPTAKIEVKSEIIGGDTVRTFGYGALHILAKKYGDKLYLIAANSSSLPIKARYTFVSEEKYLNSKVLFERRKISLSDNSLTDDFDGYGVHIYEILVEKNIK